MENDPSPFPEFRFYRPLEGLRAFVRFVCHATVVPPYLSDHYHPEHFHGASEMLDEAMEQ